MADANPRKSSLQPQSAKDEENLDPLALSEPSGKGNRLVQVLWTVVLGLGFFVLALVWIWLARSGRTAGRPVVMVGKTPSEQPLVTMGQPVLPPEDPASKAAFSATCAAIRPGVEHRRRLFETLLRDHEQAPTGPTRSRELTPHAVNWEIHFSGRSTIEVYAEQLDYFGVELGVLMPDHQITYVSHLTKPKPDRRTGPVREEHRLYFAWLRGGLARGDQDCLQRAGVAFEDKVVLKFIPPAVEATLTSLARQASSKVDVMGKVHFTIVVREDGFAFEVMNPPDHLKNPAAPPAEEKPSSEPVKEAKESPR